MAPSAAAVCHSLPLPPPAPSSLFCVQAAQCGGGEKNKKRAVHVLNHLFVEQLAGVLLDEVQVLHLASREAYQQGDGLRGSCELVEVMAGGLGPLVDALVDGLVEVNGLEPWEKTR